MTFVLGKHHLSCEERPRRGNDFRWGKTFHTRSPQNLSKQAAKTNPYIQMNNLTRINIKSKRDGRQTKFRQVRRGYEHGAVRFRFFLGDVAVRPPGPRDNASHSAAAHLALPCAAVRRVEPVGRYGEKEEMLRSLICLSAERLGCRVACISRASPLCCRWLGRKAFPLVIRKNGRQTVKHCAAGRFLKARLIKTGW